MRTKTSNYSIAVQIWSCRRGAFVVTEEYVIVLKLSIFLTFFFPKNYRTHKKTGSRFSKIHGVFPLIRIGRL